MQIVASFLGDADAESPPTPVGAKLCRQPQHSPSKNMPTSGLVFWVMLKLSLHLQQEQNYAAVTAAEQK